MEEDRIEDIIMGKQYGSRSGMPDSNLTVPGRSSMYLHKNLVLSFISKYVIFKDVPLDLVRHS